MHMVHRELAAQHMLEGVGEGPVSDVVEEAGGLNEFSFVLGEVEGLRHRAGDVAHPEAMLHPGMVRAGEDEVGQPKLPDRIQSLQLQRLEQIEGERLQADRAVNGVRDGLQVRHPSTDGRQRIKRFVRTVSRIVHQSRVAFRGTFRPRGPWTTDDSRFRRAWG